MADLFETLRNIRWRRSGARICPRCGDSGLQMSSALDGIITPTKFMCVKCGYSGNLALEAQEESERAL